MLIGPKLRRTALSFAILVFLSVGGGRCGPPASSPAPCSLPIGTTCASDTQCDDFLFCNGAEACSPGAPGASACGCIRRAPPCSTACDEVHNRCLAAGCENPDRDGDGVDSAACGGTDCDDQDPTRYPGATEICDAAGHDEDCDDTTYGYRDQDGDGHGDARCCNGIHCGDDCDDSNPVVHPGAPDLCDGLDNDCDGTVDNGEQVDTYADKDGDGHGAGPAVLQCASTRGFSRLSNDCDDTVAGVLPGAIRCTPKAGEYELCQSDGGFVVGYCPLQGTCRPQPGGNGICL